MAERDRYIPGVPCWADTTQADPEAAAEFYAGIFGWELEDTMPPGSDGKYLQARIDGRLVAAISSGAADAARWRSGTPTSGWRAPTRRSQRFATPAAPSSQSRSTSWMQVGWRHSRGLRRCEHLGVATERAPRCAGR